MLSKQGIQIQPEFYLPRQRRKWRELFFFFLIQCFKKLLKSLFWLLNNYLTSVISVLIQLNFTNFEVIQGCQLHRMFGRLFRLILQRPVACKLLMSGVQEVRMMRVCFGKVRRTNSSQTQTVVNSPFKLLGIATRTQQSSINRPTTLNTSQPAVF